MEEGELANRARQSLEAVKQRVEVELVAAPLLVSAAVVDSSQLSIKRTHLSYLILISFQMIPHFSSLNLFCLSYCH